MDVSGHQAEVPRAPTGGAQRAWVLWRYWMLRELKTRYAGSVLGLAWAFVQPLATLAIFYVLFGLVLAVRVPGLDLANGYLLHLLAGLAVWLPFTDAIGRGVACLAAHEDFLRKQPMPAEILPAVAVGSSLLVMVIGYAMLLLLSLGQGVQLRASWGWLPWLMLAQVMLTFGLTLMLSMAHFLWRDVGSVVAFSWPEGSRRWSSDRLAGIWPAVSRDGAKVAILTADRQLVLLRSRDGTVEGDVACASGEGARLVWESSESVLIEGSSPHGGALLRGTAQTCTVAAAEGGVVAS